MIVLSKLKINFEGLGEILVEIYPDKEYIVNRLFSKTPLELLAKLWGGEIYMELPEVARVVCRDRKEYVEIGDVAYSPSFRSICIYFNTTPRTYYGDKIRAEEHVEVFGKVIKGLELLSRVKPGCKVRIEYFKG
ncbi:MAG: hypothetical protein DRJ49_01910 [Thermoprotei archaeon]|nr:MAG: hypothetical protein DRJ49_01910 [Thermoprotei archaeon]